MHEIPEKSELVRYIKYLQGRLAINRDSLAHRRWYLTRIKNTRNELRHIERMERYTCYCDSCYCDYYQQEIDS